MRLFAVSRILNEADVIEPFIRHHAALVDLHIVLDNGSSDGTVEIMRALHAEGINLQVYQSVSPIFFEQVDNTALYRVALSEGADWVLFLDADELLVVADEGNPRDYLSSLSAQSICLRLPGFYYAPPRPIGCASPFERLRARRAVPDMHKIAARRAEPSRIVVAAGNHYVWVDGKPDPGIEQDRLWLAHVPDRTPLQSATKVILSRFKPEATGPRHAAFFGVHRSEDHIALKRDARSWLESWEHRTAHLVDEIVPVNYRGGPLRYTAQPDDLARMIGIIAYQSELLAQSHGSTVEANAAIARELMQQASSVARII